MGLLAALVLFFGVVGGVVWTVIKNHDPAQTADGGSGTKPSASPPVSTQPAKPAQAGSRLAVTIVADAKTRDAITKLRDITPDDGKPRKPAKPPEKKAEPKVAARLDVDGQVVDWNSSEVQTATALLKQYRALKSWKEKLPLVYQSEQARPLMEQFYGSQGFLDPTLTGMIGASNMRIGNRSVLALSYSSGERLNRVVHANFWRDPGGLRLDWESFVGFSGKSMGAFRAGHCVDPTVFRVLAIPDDYYNFEFTDPKKLLSIRLYSPDGEDYLHGYCARDSPDGRKLVEILGDSSRNQSAMATGNGLRPQANAQFPITVQLAFPEKAQSDRCVKIEKFVSPWWLALDAENQATAALEPAGSSVPRTQ